VNHCCWYQGIVWLSAKLTLFFLVLNYNMNLIFKILFRWAKLSKWIVMISISETKLFLYIHYPVTCIGFYCYFSRKAQDPKKSLIFYTSICTNKKHPSQYRHARQKFKNKITLQHDSSNLIISFLFLLPWFDFFCTSQCLLYMISTSNTNFSF